MQVVARAAPILALVMRLGPIEAGIRIGQTCYIE